jgi:hypothetical protein
VKKELLDGFIVVVGIVRTKGWAGKICPTGAITFLLYIFGVGLTKVVTLSQDQEDANVMLILLILFTSAFRDLLCIP